MDRSLKTPRGRRGRGPARPRRRHALLSPAGGGKGLHSGRGVPGVAVGEAHPSSALEALLPPGACFAFNTIGRGVAGREKEKEKKKTNSKNLI